MDLIFFENIIKQLENKTKLVALHVLGDPLVVSNLKEYLDIVKKYNLKVMITTTGYILKKEDFEILTHDSIKQINFSLNSFNKNSMNKTFDEYMQPILEFCTYKVLHNINSFINLRLWNKDDQNSEKEFNQKIFNKLNSYFNINITNNIDSKSIRLDNKVLINFDKYFIWPNLNNTYSSHGYCQGATKQIAILSNGVVVPCCLDCDGIIQLGDLNIQNLDQILKNKRTIELIEGFKKNIAVELLCQSCSYKDRFNT
jgi:MoaA/NifB/PqqE/SkfB family radical SAM enzyme